MRDDLILRDEASYLESGAYLIKDPSRERTLYLEPEGFELLCFLACSRTLAAVEQRYAALLGVAELGEDDAATLHELLERLLRDGLLVETDEPRSAPRLLRNLPAAGPPRGAASAMSFPERADFLLTRRCNLRCRHCNVAALPAEAAAADELPLPRVLEILDELDAGGLLRLNLTGGEPTVRADFEAIFSAALGHRYSLCVLTNAAALSETHHQLFAEAARRRQRGFQLGISLDGARASSHDAFRRAPGAQGRTIDSIRRLRRAGVRVSVESVIHRDNEDEAADLVRLCADLGVERLLFHPLGLIGRGAGEGGLTFDLPYLYETVYPAILALRERHAGRLRVQVEPFRNPVSEALLGGATAGGAPDALTADDSAERVVAFPDNCCPAGMSSMTIYADGEVYPCDRAIGRSMGSVRQRSVADVWRDDRWSVLRGGWSLDELELCKRCKLADACQIRSCRAYPWAVFDDLYAPAPECVHNAAFLGLQPEDVARYAGGSGAESDD